MLAASIRCLGKGTPGCAPNPLANPNNPTRSVGDSAVAYGTFEAYCRVIPNELDTFSEVFPGGTQTGNLCWSVRSSDADSLVLIVDNAFSFDQDRAYMALR